MNMRKYLKPALEIEAFDVEDIITASVGNTPNQPVIEPGSGNETGDALGDLAAPIDVIELN